VAGRNDQPGAVSDDEWAGLCRALEREAWLSDERFKTANGRIIHVQARLELTAAVLREGTSADWLRRLDREGVPCAPVLTREQVIEQEQLRVNEVIEELDHPVAGRYRQPRPAACFSETPARIRSHAPPV